ncbi:MAG TPA: DinB family protein [Ignavibacteriaceae bacterium]|nr:DinB family protein [Ignavibacteriaceae bacterium]
MYNSITEFIQDWNDEANATLKIFSSMTDESLNQSFQNYRRTIGCLAWHITGAIGEMMRSAGSPIKAAEESNRQPDSAAEIINEYKKASENLIEIVEREWSDSCLKEKVNMYGEMWARGNVLKVLIIHQIHHRAQITVLMRLAGLKVPGIYGPSYEEWKQFGMEPQK